MTVIVLTVSSDNAYEGKKEAKDYKTGNKNAAMTTSQTQ